ncbi:TetR/AcrR family transcriptional regulator [Polycladidibacter hongkongensis]|uniref:TetR/AcrR family transcriptional regulator n=1 Tax=Polycladidibacter hongkongensis TaxID=1647556 RepID=UPI0008355797|nr:TetR/AcrR family transcriptional regulator [Pseudovibrio hongkongensis]
MARTKGSIGKDTQAAIWQTAKKLIVSHGFEAMTLRQLAAEVGLQPASIYRYIKSKDELLQSLMLEHMGQLLTACQKAVPRHATATRKLEAFVAFHIRYHIERRTDVILANLELRSLQGEAHAQVVTKRRSYEEQLIAILEHGRNEGAFAINELEVAAYAILAMLTGVCFWYNPKGRLSIEEIINEHIALVMRGVAASK